MFFYYTGWRTKCHTIDCTHNTFLFLQKHLTSGTELILIGWKIVPNEEHVQCDHCFASQPLANEPLHSSQLCKCTDTGGKQPLLPQHRSISFKLLAKSVNCLFARSPPCSKVCKKTSLSLYDTLCFCVKQYIQLSPFDLQSTARCPPFYKLVCWLSAMVNSDCLWHLLHFPWTTVFTRTFAILILWCYNFNGIIKWYDITCVTLYFWQTDLLTPWPCGPMRPLASLITGDLSSLSTAFCHHLLTFFSCGSFYIPTNHLNLGFLLLLLPSDLLSNTFFTLLPWSVLTTYPINSKFFFLISAAMSRSSYSSLSSLLFLILHIPCCNTGPYILLNILLSNVPSVFISVSIIAHVSLPFARVGFTIFYIS